MARRLRRARRRQHRRHGDRRTLLPDRAGRHRLEHLRDLPDRPPGAREEVTRPAVPSEKVQTMPLPPVLSKIIEWLRAATRKACPSTTTSRCSPSSAASSRMRTSTSSAMSWRLPPTPSRRSDQEGDRRGHPHHAERRRHQQGPLAAGGGRLAARQARTRRLAGHCGPHNQGSARPSRVKVPVGPPFGKVAAHTTLAAPWANVRERPPGRLPSFGIQPGQTALTRIRPCTARRPASWSAR